MPSNRPLTLILWRHAKAVDHHPDGDHARPLVAVGLADAARVAAELDRRGLRPDHVLLSDSARTTQTWEAAAAIWPGIPSASRRDLYGAGSAGIRNVAEQAPASARTVMLIGHNPGWSELASELAGRSLALRKADAVVLRTKAGDWAAALHGPWELLVHLVARELRPGK